MLLQRRSAISVDGVLKFKDARTCQVLKEVLKFSIAQAHNLIKLFCPWFALR